MTEKELKMLTIENRIKKLSTNPAENKRLIAKWERIKRALMKEND